MHWTLYQQTIFFKVRAPVSDTYTLYMSANRITYLYINTFNDPSAAHVLTVLLSQGTYSTYLNQNQFYDFKIIWYDFVNDSNVTLRWSYTGQTEITIPSEYLYFPKHVQDTVYDVQSFCPNGYTGYNSSTPTY